MAGDLKSQPHSPDSPYKHVFVCKKYPELRIVYKRKDDPIEDREGRIIGKEPRDQYLGFLRTAIGGIYQTNSDAVARFVREMPQFADGDIVEYAHAELGKALTGAKIQERVSTGALGSVPTSGDAPKPPDEQPPAVPKAAKGPKRHPVGA